MGKVDGLNGIVEWGKVEVALGDLFTQRCGGGGGGVQWWVLSEEEQDGMGQAGGENEEVDGWIRVRVSEMNGREDGGGWIE
jgi:hypothetical protein